MKRDDFPILSGLALTSSAPCVPEGRGLPLEAEAGTPAPQDGGRARDALFNWGGRTRTPRHAEAARPLYTHSKEERRNGKEGRVLDTTDTNKREEFD
ncbi:Protein of unknown function [Gryllus bimaculatus]|nr:Protein of unknown function [Gryllus bimaculatus]